MSGGEEVVTTRRGEGVARLVPARTAGARRLGVDRGRWTASSWEIATKYQLGWLPLPEGPERYVPQRLRAIDGHAVAVEHSHALAVEGLPPLHRDPFDRLLVAQATVLDLTLVTADPAVAAYPVDTVLV